MKKPDEKPKKDKYIESKRKKAKVWLTEKEADKLLKEIRER